MKWLKFNIGLILPLVATVSVADEYHFKDIIIGDRAAGMAGAYTAIADDPSGMYYNPAGIVYSAGPKVSGSVNAYSIVTTKYDNINSSDWTWETNSKAMVANFFGIYQPVGPGVAGFSVAVPDFVLEDQDEKFENSGSADASLTNLLHVRNYNNEDNTTYMGPSYSMEVMDGLSVGLTLYMHTRSQELIQNEFIKAQKGTLIGYEWTNYYDQTSEMGVRPVFGVMWSPFEKLAFGFSYAKTTLISSTPEQQQSKFSTIQNAKDGDTKSSPLDPSNTNIQVIFDTIYQGAENQIDDTDDIAGNDSLAQLIWEPELRKAVERVFPNEFNFGVAYFANESLVLSADINYYLYLISSTELKKSYQDTFNLSLGAEYFVSNTWAIRGGGFTNNTFTPELNDPLDPNVDRAEAVGQLPHVDLKGLALSVTRYDKESSITLGMNFSSGTGKAQLSSVTNELQGAEISSLAFFLSTTTSF
jgi:long-subunit fatty acid transport protein